MCVCVREVLRWWGLRLDELRVKVGVKVVVVVVSLVVVAED